MRNQVLLVLLALALGSLTVRGGGVVSTATEASLNTALSGGGTVTFSCSGTITITSRKLISADTVIDGTGQTMTISGNNLVRVFEVNPGVQLTIKNLTIANGRSVGANGSDGANGGPSALTFPTDGGTGGQGYGGAIYNNGGTIVVWACTFSGHTVIGGNGGKGGNGGASVSQKGAKGGNGGIATGAAIFSAGGSVTLLDSTFASNTSTGGTGGRGGDGSTGSNANGGNGGAGGAGLGGDIYSGGPVSIINCTFYNCRGTGGVGGAGGTGYGVLGEGGNGGSGGAGRGGSIHAIAGAPVTALSTTMSANAATGGAGGARGTGAFNGSNGSAGASTGGAVYVPAGGSVTLQNAIVANSTSGGNASGTITDSGNNISSDATCAFTAPTSFNSTNPQFSAGLTENGGRTATVPIGAASPARDAGNAAAALATDQRGYYRLGNPDIGAFEYGGAPCQALIKATGPEASEDGDVGLFRVYRNGDLSAALTVNLTISGSAINGIDYTTIANSVSIPAGRDSARILVTPISDAISETNELVILTVASGTGYVAGSPSNATVVLAEKSLFARDKRYFRGKGTEPSYHSFIVPLDAQKGVLLTNVGGNLTTLFPGNPWTTTYYHYDATRPLGASNVNQRIQFNGPVVAFGSRVGGTPLYVGENHSLGAYAGLCQATNINQIVIKAYNRTGFTLAGTLNIYIPQEWETDAWKAFSTNGYSKTVTQNGLRELGEQPGRDGNTSELRQQCRELRRYGQHALP
jgi:hypothetical protein